MANERLAQYNTYQETHLGFKGIIAGVADELIPDGYVPDMENLKITVEGIASAIPNPNVYAPPTGQTDLKSIFVWQRDDGTKLLLAQYGTHLYKWDVSLTPDAWTEIFKGTPADDAAFGSTAKASFAAGMGDKVYIVQEATHMMSYDGTTLVELWNGPMGKYVSLWKNRYFVAGVTHFYGLAASTTAHGTETDATSTGTVIWSNINIADDTHGGATHDNGWYTGSIVELRTPENSRCTGLLPVEENLLMFTESAIFTFSGYTEENFSLFDYYHGANTPKENAIVSAGGVFYVSPDGFFQLSKEPKIISEAIKPLIDPSDSVVSCAYYDDRLWFLTGGTLVALNKGNASWEKYRLGGLYGTTETGVQNIVYGADYLYIGTSTGYILKVGESNAVTPGYRPWYLNTPVLNQGITTGQKRYKSVYIYAKNTSSRLNAAYATDYGADVSIIPTIDGIQSGHKWGELIWGTDEWSGANADMMIYKRFIVSQLARTIRFTFGNSDVNGNAEGALLGYAIVYTPKRKFGVR
jgi:hypothetical protein